MASTLLADYYCLLCRTLPVRGGSFYYLPTGLPRPFVSGKARTDGEMHSIRNYRDVRSFTPRRCDVGVIVPDNRNEIRLCKIADVESSAFDSSFSCCEKKILKHSRQVF